MYPGLGTERTLGKEGENHYRVKKRKGERNRESKMFSRDTSNKNGIWTQSRVGMDLRS